MGNYWDGWNKKGTSTDSAFSGTELATRCYESHPVLKLGKGKLYGGAARSPKVKDADVYVVLQSGDMNGWQSDPWEKQQITEVYYGIRDMDAPADVPRFKKLVTWVCNQLQSGKTVHVGCIGGHGRTGTVLSAIVAELKGEKNAIQYVRKHYCKKAVESKSQIHFLMKHYGVSEAEPTKGYKQPVLKPVDTFDDVPTSAPLYRQGQGPWVDRKKDSPLVKRDSPLLGKVRRVIPEGLTKATKSYGPMASKRSLWSAKNAKKREQLTN